MVRNERGKQPAETARTGQGLAKAPHLRVLIESSPQLFGVLQLILQTEKERGSEKLRETLKVTWPKSGALGAQRLGNFLPEDLLR